MLLYLLLFFYFFILLIFSPCPTYDGALGDESGVDQVDRDLHVLRLVLELPGDVAHDTRVQQYPTTRVPMIPEYNNTGLLYHT